MSRLRNDYGITSHYQLEKNTILSSLFLRAYSIWKYIYCAIYIKFSIILFIPIAYTQKSIELDTDATQSFLLECQKTSSRIIMKNIKNITVKI